MAQFLLILRDDPSTYAELSPAEMQAMLAEQAEQFARMLQEDYTYEMWRDEMRETIRAVGELLEVRASRSKPDRGIVRYRMEVFNQRDEAVMTMTSATIVRRQPTPSGGAAAA